MCDISMDRGRWDKSNDIIFKATREGQGHVWPSKLLKWWARDDRHPLTGVIFILIIDSLINDEEMISNDKVYLRAH